MNTSDALMAARELQLLNAQSTDVEFHGFSMEPLLTEGDRIVLEAVAFSDICLGDIITYLHENKYPTRRVVNIKQNRVTLWCDNWPNRRFSTEPDKILTRVVSRERNGEVLSNSDAEWLLLTNKALRTYKVSKIRHYFKRIRRRISSVVSCK